MARRTFRRALPPGFVFVRLRLAKPNGEPETAVTLRTPSQCYAFEPGITQPVPEAIWKRLRDDGRFEAV